MTTITRTFTVDPSPDVVLTYLKDFGNAEEWDPGTQECRRVDEGPIRVGSRWHNRSKIAGMSTELLYELVELSDSRVRFEGRNETAATVDTIDVVPTDGGGSKITYQADIEMKGAAKLATPVVKVVFEKIGSDTEDDLVTILNRLAGPGRIAKLIDEGEQIADPGESR